MTILGSPYCGAKATEYDAKRVTQQKWHDENEIVAEMMRGATGSVLDVPVGTGRFLPIYKSLRLVVTGVDASTDMLKEARKKASRRDRLFQGDATKMDFAEQREFDTVVCVRLLHLMKQDDALKILGEILRVADKRVILTVQLGVEKHVGHDTATHEEHEIMRFITARRWRVTDDRVITSAGWHVMRLDR